MVYKQNTLFLVLRLMVILAVMMAIPFLTRFIEKDQLIFTYVVIVLILGDPDLRTHPLSPTGATGN